MAHTRTAHYGRHRARRQPRVTAGAHAGALALDRQHPPLAVDDEEVDRTLARLRGAEVGVVVEDVVLLGEPGAQRVVPEKAGGRVGEGVGLVLDAGRPVRATRVVVATETPGFTASVRVGSSPAGPFVSVSKEQSLKARTGFVLTPRSGRYLMLWITSTMRTKKRCQQSPMTASRGAR